MRVRATPTADSPLHSMATTGPLVMNSIEIGKERLLGVLGVVAARHLLVDHQHPDLAEAEPFALQPAR